ncbi:bowman-birk serine protease inhibitor family protein (macronuclear) [Tetrahymena thermophila SB210]|uniref:Bowman-birk serine protease inhibitor family protein n=1 Tax=Tetrahymena thermophila (strain SB210) TaxID=312017 RepID=I7M725_TETTS|nr:bowman-birk serine protease inhibitor family protein [Tetrahymena thermophila SB210]EAR87724.2 bowman-birk serine protease inhibitor family protein [Tetrahymena thermophila SB210]|eukprot:XP_001007969.2 bowman-birk serine protease inhibitor family protein [Tetrahymena thermophila SB210]
MVLKSKITFNQIFYLLSKSFIKTLDQILCQQKRILLVIFNISGQKFFKTYINNQLFLLQIFFKFIGQPQSISNQEIKKNRYQYNLNQIVIHQISRKKDINQNQFMPSLKMMTSLKKALLFLMFTLQCLVKAQTEMVQVAFELQGNVQMSDLVNWTCLQKNVIVVSGGIQNWALTSLGPLGQNVPASRTISGLTPHNQLIFTIDVFYQYIATPFTGTDNIQVILDGTQASYLTFTPYDGFTFANLITCTGNLTHTVNTLSLNVISNYVRPLSDQSYYIRNFQAWVKPCHFSCTQCSASNSQICTSCPAYATLNGNLCTCDNSHFMLSNNCVSSCPSGYTPDTVNRICLLNVLNCATPKNITACSACNAGYFLNAQDLTCYSSCPMGLETVGNNCQPYEYKLSPQTGLLLFSLFDRPWATNKEFSVKGTSFSICGGCNGQYSIRISGWCGNDKIFGGYGSQTSMSWSKQITAPPHYRYRLYVKLYLIDNWTGGGSVTITVDSNTYTYTTANCPWYQQLCGSLAYNDCIIIVDQIVPHTTTPINISMSSSVGQGSTQQTFGFNNFYFAVDQCTPNCIACTFTTINACTQCAPGYYLNTLDSLCYNPCPNGQYGSNGVCYPCAVQCATCITSAANCLTCAANRIGPPTCNCADGSFSLNGTAANCTPCNFRCATCSNTATNCTQCAANRDPLTIPACNCLVNNYEIAGTPACQPCFNVCSQCTGPNQPQCTACKSPTRDPNQACACAAHYFGDFNNLACNTCDPTCWNCSNTSTNCTSCPAGSAPANTLPRNLNVNQCICPQGSYDTLQPYCPTCNYRCAICTGPTSTPADCQQCQPGRQLANNCACISGFDIVGQATCSACPVQCQTCDGLGNCLVCAGTTRQAIPQCLCKPGYYENNTPECAQCMSKCGTCVNGTACTSCAAGRDPPNCDCQYGKYSDANGVCQPCHPNCLSCSGPGSNQCIQCSPNRVSPPYCNCPIGTFSITNQVTCPRCDPTCLTCNGPNPNNCTSCDTSNRILSGNQCVCQDGYFSNIYGQCQQCSSFCAKCSDLQTCTQCNGNRYGNNCSCPSGFLDTQVAVCPACDPRCAECSVTSNNCTVCAANRITQPQCPCSPGFYEIANTKQCDVCQWQCATCQTTSDTCLSCRGNRIYIQTQNDCICPDYTYEDYVSQQCPSCHRSCKKCSGGLASNCVICRDSYVRDSLNNCICPSNTYEDKINFVCKQCDVSCLTCAGSSNSQCTQCASGYLNQQGICVKQSGQAGTCSPLCTSCDSNFNCIGCKDTLRQVLNGKCVCLGGTYDAVTSCQNCNSTCLQCSGASPSSCTQCREGFVLTSEGYCKIDVTDQNSKGLMIGLVVGFSVFVGLILIYVIYRIVKNQLAKQAAAENYVYQDSRHLDEQSQIDMNRSQGINSPQNHIQHQNTQHFQNQYMRASFY